MRAILAEHVRGARRPLRVRLLVDPEGTPRVEAAPLGPLPSPQRAALAAGLIDSADPLFFHKTTHRAML